MARKTLRRELVQLAKHLDFAKHRVAGAWVSEKLNGLRGFWDGGCTQGMDVDIVPWANDQRDKTVRKSTGLWTRLGKPINAHPSWLKLLPKGLCLDGELYLGKDALEDTMAVRDKAPEKKFWDQVRFEVFDSPSKAFFTDGEIVFDSKTRKWAQFSGTGFDWAGCTHVGSTEKFEARYDWLKMMMTNHGLIGKGAKDPRIALITYDRLPTDEYVARRQLQDKFEEVVADGSEGLMIRLAYQDLWLPQRVGTLLKMKPTIESEGVVVGYFAGKEGKEGRRLGMLGAVEISWNGVNGLSEPIIFTVAGFNTRECGLGSGTSWAYQNPGARMPDEYNHPLFPVGSILPFKYAAVTQAGVPVSARFDRGTHRGNG